MYIYSHAECSLLVRGLSFAWFSSSREEAHAVIHVPYGELLFYPTINFSLVQDILIAFEIPPADSVLYDDSVLPESN